MKTFEIWAKREMSPAWKKALPVDERGKPVRSRPGPISNFLALFQPWPLRKGAWWR